MYHIHFSHITDVKSATHSNSKSSLISYRTTWSSRSLINRRQGSKADMSEKITSWGNLWNAQPLVNTEGVFFLKGYQPNPQKSCWLNSKNHCLPFLFGFKSCAADVAEPEHWCRPFQASPWKCRSASCFLQSTKEKCPGSRAFLGRN